MGVVNFIRRRGRIKAGATILHDMRAWTWPDNANKEPADPNMVFYIDSMWPNGWKCIADGFGASSTNGIKGIYRNGAILLHNEEDLELLPEVSGKKRKSKDA